MLAGCQRSPTRQGRTPRQGVTECQCRVRASNAAGLEVAVPGRRPPALRRADTPLSVRGATVTTVPQEPKPPRWLTDAISSFGADAREKLAGPGQAEANIRTPLEVLLRRVGAHIGRTVVFFDEVRYSDRRVRPDYAFSADGALTGYV